MEEVGSLGRYLEPDGFGSTRSTEFVEGLWNDEASGT